MTFFTRPASQRRLFLCIRHAGGAATLVRAVSVTTGEADPDAPLLGMGASEPGSTQIRFPRLRFARGVISCPKLRGSGALWHLRCRSSLSGAVRF